MHAVQAITSLKAERLANAQSLDKHFYSTYKEVENLSRHIYDKYLTEQHCPKYYRLKKSIECILLNLIHVNAIDPSRYVRFAMRSAPYTKSRYNSLPLSWRSLERIVRCFRIKGLIEFTPGIPNQDGFGKRGKQSRMRPTSLLLDLVSRFRVGPEMVMSLEDETILLKGAKDKDGRASLIGYRDGHKTRAMRQNLHRINSALAESSIDIYVPDEGLCLLNEYMGRDRDRTPIDFGRKRLRRIFNNKSFEQGGRFYHGWWQEVPKDFRSYITIDYNETIELDYSGIHFAIFYAEVGMEPPDDPYKLGGTSDRERGIIKKALNAMINAPTEESALRAIQQEARGFDFPIQYPRSKQLIRGLKDRHSPIKHLICTGAGLRAQLVDSRIAEHVLLTLIEQGITALPVHDSFLVSARYELELKQAMSGAFESIVKGECGVDAKIPAWTKATLGFKPPNEVLTLKESILAGEYRGYQLRELSWQRHRNAKLLGSK